MIDMGDGYIVSPVDKTFLQKMEVKDRYEWWKKIKKVTRLDFTERVRAEETCKMLSARTGFPWKIENSIFTGFYHEKRQRT